MSAGFAKRQPSDHDICLNRLVESLLDTMVSPDSFSSKAKRDIESALARVALATDLKSYVIRQLAVLINKVLPSTSTNHVKRFRHTIIETVSKVSPSHSLIAQERLTEIDRLDSLSLVVGAPFNVDRRIYKGIQNRQNAYKQMGKGKLSRYAGEYVAMVGDKVLKHDPRFATLYQQLKTKNEFLEIGIVYVSQ